jgi:hypothetical protein
LYGGQYAEFSAFLEDVLDCFASRHITLTFVFDGFGSKEARAQKSDTLQQRMEETLDKVLSVVDFCDTGAVPRGGLGSQIPMPILTMAQAKATIKRKG